MFFPSKLNIFLKIDPSSALSSPCVLYDPVELVPAPKPLLLCPLSRLSTGNTVYCLKGANKQTTSAKL